ncbi:MAG: hypothetical protein M1431_07920 [Candidatus Thermoplasmatota archaeon]|nr:hypothetical protein [Candidatus Thermoplasmatota archaeon]
MDNKLVLAITVAVLMTGSAFALAGAFASAPQSPVHTSLGNYSFSYYGGNGTLTNVSYMGQDNQGSGLIVDYAQISGKNLSTFMTTSDIQGSSDMKTMNLANETLVAGQDSNTLLILTTPGGVSSSGASVTIKFNGTVKQVQSGVDLASSNDFFGSVSTTFTVSGGYKIYQIDTANFTGYFVSNGATQTISNSNTLSISSSTGTLVSGIVASGDFKDLMEKYAREHNHGNAFTYNTTTGNVTGRFVDFNFNATTGVISNFSMSNTQTKVFSKITASGNGTIGSQSEFPAFRTGVPMVYGNLFFYANSSYIYTLHDNPAMQFDMILNNGTMKFHIPVGLNVSNLSSLRGSFDSSAEVNATDINQNESAAINATVESDHEFYRGNSMFFLHNSTVRAMLDVAGGSAAYNSTTGVLTVMTNRTASINFVAPPGLNQVPSRFIKPVEYGIEHGKIAAQVSIASLNSTAVNFTTMYNNSVNMKITAVGSGKVNIAVSSSEHAGTNLLFFVNQSFLNSGGKIYVYFDGVLANLTSFNGTINVTSNSAAFYGFEQVNGGYLVIVHVPHFSNHTITISDALISSGTSTTGLPLSPVELGVIAAVVVAAVAGTVVAIRKK